MIDKCAQLGVDPAALLNQPAIRGPATDLAARKAAEAIALLKRLGLLKIDGGAAGVSSLR
jgi:hypothetical protein